MLYGVVEGKHKMEIKFFLSPKRLSRFNAVAKMRIVLTEISSQNPLRSDLKKLFREERTIKCRESQLVKLEIIHFDMKKIECYANGEKKKPRK